MPELLPSPAEPRLSPRATAVLMQLVLWLLLCGFYFAWNNRPNYHFTGPIWPYVLLEWGFAIGLFNCLVYLIIPRWLLRGRFGLALLGAVVLIYTYRLWMYAGALLIIHYAPISADLRYNLQKSYAESPWPDLTSWRGLLGSLMDLLATVLFPIVISFVTYALVIERRRLALERDHLHLELSYLKAQINPQFLFNTLGTLQRLTRSRDRRAGDVVLHLADLMRYTLYETDTERVALSRELEFLEDYLALERLLHPEATITHEVEGTVTTQQLAPLLLHPFLERLFVGIEAVPGSSVHIQSTIQVEADTLTLLIIRTTGVPLAHLYRTDAAIEAALRRLALQYPQQHTVQLTEENAHLRLHLRLQL